MNIFAGWVLFAVFVITMLVIDLRSVKGKEHVIKIREALLRSAGWISLALAFNLIIYIYSGHEKAMEFMAAYLIEQSLSMDNIFVFLMIFTYFKVPPQYEHRVLFWGILGAVFMRAVFIFAGLALISMFHWVLYIFGAFLIFTGIKMAIKSDDEIHPEKNPVLKLFRKIVPVTSDYHAEHFFMKQGKTWAATPLIIVLIVIETTDLIFAVDSIPAVLAISRDSFIVYTSNIFAILGLRSLYFTLAGLMKLFRFLNYGLSVILAFVGVKMLLPLVVSEEFKIPILLVLLVIVSVLALSIMVSVLIPEKKPTPAGHDATGNKPSAG